MGRKAYNELKTPETEVIVEIELDGLGKAEVDTGIKFLNHALVTLAKYGKVDLKVKAKGDLIHHIVEDTAICLGKSIRKALGNHPKIKRFGFAIVPMDDSLVMTAVDLADRIYPVVKLNLKGNMIEDIDVHNAKHFLRSLITSIRATIHVVLIHGENSHHIFEAAIKSLAIALRQAISR
jgi:imidazoleglycerol-phosphate dehydratase